MDDHVRASDQDREQAAQSLREHFAAGRLNQTELDERVQSAYRASTTAELRAVVRDLPALPATPQELRAEHVARRNQLQRRLLQQAGGSLGLFVVCTVIWLASGAHGQFWPLWVGLLVVLTLVRGTWGLYGPAPDLDRVQRHLDRGDEDRHGRREERQARRDERRGHRGGPPRLP